MKRGESVAQTSDWKTNLVTKSWTTLNIMTSRSLIYAYFWAPDHESDEDEVSLTRDPSESWESSELELLPISKHFLHLRSGVTISATRRKLVTPYDHPHFDRHLLGGLESSTVDPMWTIGERTLFTNAYWGLVTASCSFWSSVCSRLTWACCVDAFCCSASMSAELIGVGGRLWSTSPTGWGCNGMLGPNPARLENTSSSPRMCVVTSGTTARAASCVYLCMSNVQEAVSIAGVCLQQLAFGHLPLGGNALQIFEDVDREHRDGSTLVQSQLSPPWSLRPSEPWMELCLLYRGIEVSGVMIAPRSWSGFWRGAVPLHGRDTSGGPWSDKCTSDSSRSACQRCLFCKWVWVYILHESRLEGGLPVLRPSRSL